jgi:hypothetical protein
MIRLTDDPDPDPGGPESCGSGSATLVFGNIDIKHFRTVKCYISFNS